MPKPNSPYSPLKRSHWRLSAWYFFYFAFLGAFAPYFTLYLQSLGLTAPAIGTLMSLMLAMRLLAPSLWSWLAERFERKVVLIRASAVFAIAGYLLFFLANTFWALFAAMGLMAFFWSAALPLVEALTLGHLAGRTEQYGRIRLWGSVGFIVAVLGTGAWLDRVALENVLWVNLGLLVGVLICAIWLLDVPGKFGSEAGQRLRDGLLRRHVFALLAACFFMSAAHSPFYLFFSIHLVGYGYDKTTVGLLWSLGVVAEIAVFVVMPRLVRNWTLRSILLTSFLLAVIRFLLIGWSADSALLLIVAQLMHGATFGAYHAAAVAALNGWFPARQQGRVQALYSSVSYGAGGMFGNITSSAVWGWFGAGPAFSLGALFALISVLLTWRYWRQPDENHECPVR